MEATPTATHAVTRDRVTSEPHKPGRRLYHGGCGTRIEDRDDRVVRERLDRLEHLERRLRPLRHLRDP